MTRPQDIKYEGNQIYVNQYLIKAIQIPISNLEGKGIKRKNVRQQKDEETRGGMCLQLK